MFVASLQGSVPDGGKMRYLACWVSSKGILLSGSVPAGWQGKAEVRTFRYSGAGGPGCADGRFSAAGGILSCFDIAFNLVRHVFVRNNPSFVKNLQYEVQ